MEMGNITPKYELNQFNLCLVGSLWSESPFNLNAFQSTLNYIWRLKQGVDIKEIGKNLFLFLILSPEG